INAVEQFQAEYTVFKGATMVGNAVLSMTANKDAVLWQLETKPSGIFILLTSKKPFSESVMHKTENEFRLASTLIAHRRNDAPHETAHFDLQQQQVEVFAEGQYKRYPLESAVYDYLSIHWLAANMTQNKDRQIEFDFYRRAKITRSKLRLVAQSELEIDGKTRGVRCYVQTFQSSSSKYRYCYDLDNPLLPLEIENTKPGRDPSTI
ncbi:MAG: DUF3108 domain-containing protein, partial [Gammaproteobacteria bacterium]|nr:DUF3108 domain-containing protein [Gammaproteobacteria bacterium]